MDVLGGGTSFGIQSAVTECVSAMQISNQLFGPDSHLTTLNYHEQLPMTKA